MAKTLKIGTFNVENLAPAGVTYYEEKWSEADFKAKSGWIAGQLQRMNAQIVGFQEVWRESTLREVCVASERFTASQVWAPGTEEGTPKFSKGPFVGIASTLPLVGEVQTFEQFPSGVATEVEGIKLPVAAFSRPVLKATFALEGDRTLTAFVTHLKSKRGIMYAGAPQDDPREEALGKARALIRRASEAAALRFLIVQEIEQNNRPVVVLGDLNDGTSSVTTEMVTGSRPFRYRPTAEKKPIWDRLLYNAWELHAARSTRDIGYTHIYNGIYENLDHVLVSQELVADNPDRIGEVIDMRYFNDHLIDGMLSDERKGRAQSDHGQIVAEIRLRDVPKK